MAEEIINSSMTTPERIEHDGRSSRRNSAEKQSSRNNGRNFFPRRASIGSCHDGNSSKKNSAGKPNSPDAGNIIVPHYLRASTGSCHDFCKYGRKHAFEVKARHPILKRVMTPSSDKQNSIGTVAPAEKKKTAVVKLKPSPDSKTHSPDPPEIIKREILLPSKTKEVPLKQDLSNAEKMTENEKRMKNLFAKRAPINSKPRAVKSSFSIDTSVLNGRKNGDIKIGKNTETFKASVKRVLAAPTGTLSPKPSVSRLVSLNGRKPRSMKLGSPLKDQNRILDKKTETSKASVKRVVAASTGTLSPRPSVSRIVSLNARKHTSMKLESPLKDQRRTRNIKPKQSNNDKEKTLHVVEGEIEKKCSVFIQDGSVVPSPQSPSLPLPKTTSHLNSSCLSSHEDGDKKESEYSESDEDQESEYSESDSESDDFISENEETVNFSEVEIVEGNHKKILRMGDVVLSEDKDCAPMKLKFRRGKIVDLQSENNGPRRIRFRRGRVLGGSQDSKSATRRSFKKRGVDDDTNGSKSNSEKVNLRHQDVKGKKDSQGLFNNVIEETASKLVESRKGKVKALVGAFETVISLQDGKPSTRSGT